jgi:hypothetical protein
MDSIYGFICDLEKIQGLGLQALPVWEVFSAPSSRMWVEHDMPHDNKYTNHALIRINEVDDWSTFIQGKFILGFASSPVLGRTGLWIETDYKNANQ